MSAPAPPGFRRSMLPQRCRTHRGQRHKKRLSRTDLPLGGKCNSKWTKKAPATPTRAEPIPKESELMRSVLIPMRRAASRSISVARIALPVSRLLQENQHAGGSDYAPDGSRDLRNTEINARQYARFPAVWWPAKAGNPESKSKQPD